MDGLLIDSEDLYSLCTNELLHEYGKGDLPWSIKAQMQGRPGPYAAQIFHNWAQLPLTHDEFMAKQSVLQRKYFPSTQPLPGVPTLLENLKKSESNTNTHKRTYSALATSSHKGNFHLKTDHLKPLFAHFDEHVRVLGDDTRIPKGRGKPAPDIYFLALETVNSRIRERNQRGGEQEKEVTPAECLVFEDSVPGVEAGRRAGMQVVWCPHPGLLQEYRGREAEVLAGMTGMSAEGTEKVGEVGDAWARLFENLVDFPYKDYGIQV